MFKITLNSKRNIVDVASSPTFLMAFSVPGNTANSGNLHRRYEDTQHEGLGSQSLNSDGTIKGAARRLSSMFGASEELPLYKDKPYRGRPTKKLSQRPKGFLTLFVLLFFVCIYWIGTALRPSASKELQKKVRPAWFTFFGSTSSPKWEERQEALKLTFEKRWATYRKGGWGYDQYNPATKMRQNVVDGGIGWVIVNNLDALILMNMTSELQEAHSWIFKSLNFDKDQELSTYEGTSRVLGGLLSAHYLSSTFPSMAPIVTTEDGEDLYLEKAIDLADRLLDAFESTTGIPYPKYNVMGSEQKPEGVDKLNTSIADSTGLQLELRYISKLTGEKLFWDSAEKVMQAIENARAKTYLLPQTISPEKGNFLNNHIKLGGGSDNYFSKYSIHHICCFVVLTYFQGYLLNQYLQSSQQEPIYSQIWEEVLQSIQEHLVTYSSPSNLSIIGERPKGLDGGIKPRMDHSSCFLPGYVALSTTGGLTITQLQKEKKWGSRQEDNMELARRLMKTCWAMCKYSPSQLTTESTDFNIYNPAKMKKSYGFMKSVDSIDAAEDADWRQDFAPRPDNVYTFLSPKVAESLLYLWRITEDEIYREWGWSLFEAHVKSSAFDNGSYRQQEGLDEYDPVRGEEMDVFLPVSAYSPRYFS